MLQHLRWFVLFLALSSLPSVVEAEQVRYRFVPTDACGTTKQVVVGPEGTIGELRRGLGMKPLPYPYAVRPSQMVTFRHPYTGRNVTVPMRFTDLTPRVENRSDRIVYYCGDYDVEARFLPDGSVDVVYNSGVLRPLRFE